MEAMAQTAHASHHRSYVTKAQACPNVDDEDTEDDDQLSEASDESDESSNKRRRAALTVKHDMAKLESIFHEKGMKYRMIDRIGEGTATRECLERCCAHVIHQEPFQPSTKQRT